MSTFDNYLRQFPDYTPQAYRDVQPHLTIKELAEGEYFLREGKTCTEIGFVQSGLLRLYYLNDGKEVTNCFCKEHTITTSFRSLVSQQESDMAIQAVEKTRLIVFSYDSLQHLYSKSFFWQQLGRLATESEAITNECHTRFLRDVPAIDRYRKILTDDPELLQRVPLNYLATYLQMTPETLSRVRKSISKT